MCRFGIRKFKLDGGIHIRGDEFYEDMIYKLDKNAFKPEGVIKNYKIEKDTLAYNPMGGLMVSIIVNDDENLYINYN